MSESEKQAIVEAGVRTIVDEHQETVDLARDETAGPSTRPACSAEQAGLGRDDSIILDESQEPAEGADKKPQVPPLRLKPSVRMTALVKRLRSKRETRNPKLPPGLRSKLET